MIIVHEDNEGTIKRVSGNPVMTSLDGEVKAPLRVIMHASWSEEDRAKFGIYQVEPVIVPEGKQVTDRRLVRVNDTIVEVADFEDAPTPVERGPSAVEELRQDVERLAQRVAELEKAPQG